RACRPYADHRHRVEAEPERVGHAEHLQHVRVAQPPVPRADGRLGDADLGGDPAERLATVALERLDDALVERVDLRRALDRAALRLRIPGRFELATAQCEALLINRRAMRQTEAGRSAAS